MRKTRKRFTSILSLILSLAMMATIAVLPASATTLSESQTSYGFFKSVGATKALQVLNQSFFKSYMHRGDPNDATSLNNMLKALDVIDATNQYRSKEGKQALKVTDTMMAIGETESNYASQTHTHSYQYNNTDWGVLSNLAVGSSNSFSPQGAAQGWYAEKPKNNPSEEWIYKNWKSVGHYYTMMSEYYAQGDTLSGAGYNSTTRKKLQGLTSSCCVQTFGTKTYNGERTYTVSQYRNRLKNYMNNGGSNKSTNTSSQNTNRNTNTSNRNNNGTTYNNGVYSSTATTVVRQSNPTGTKSDYKDFRGVGNRPIQKGKVIVYVQEMVNDDLFGFYADIRIVNGTGKTIKLEGIPQLAIYSDDGLICSSPRSAGYAVGKTISPNSECFIGNVKFNNIHANRNFTTGMLRVESTVTYTLA